MGHIKSVNLPKQINKDILKLVGIAFGDGYLKNDKKNGYKLHYCLNNKTDIEYSHYVQRLFFKIFKQELNYSVDKNRIYLWYISKMVVEFMHNNLEIPYSPKEDLRIPSYIMKENSYLIPFLRGLFDTDGCITLQRDGKYNYILIKICTKHKHFAIDIINGLYLLNIPSFLTQKEYMGFRGYDVVVRNKNVKPFLEVIGSNNPRNLLKYKILT
ncbi:MAG: hypothetical protein KJ623_00420 [Nanoarchaeota archaeon]|nr:hypothetical protein [Nanoarchaeota archaeon]MBU0962416.1 hypothetical protein [Nanoarchaeota archaeon]